ncbi:aminoglycoside phosphotransferase [endosymbiont of Acanthamoeba sp. UWC8]|uniref:aminoglycoside phosphotransferase family protein n=1 Tax=endosymbiont of Acanthamoeba sp. UWC8 TaxID=86106 RepID=UPI0004D0DDAD|nr:aminoglycoside phosphotransferase family protein [endosymbiont of Acanthamoeba sp. UWC8]AIF80660.1 aminoglycoside phosphotransferase [endosymbiont of Acanthamoeba sp. UWC8]
MAKMHENELEVDEYLVHKLLKSQFPHWADLPLEAVISSGTDNALFRLGSEYVVRLPRIDWATESINKEYEWVPRISRFLKVPISEPLFKGNPDKSYPWSWIIAKWHEGHNPDFENGDEYGLLAQDLAHFLNGLHGIKLANGSFSRRGIPLKELDIETREAICKLEGEIDIPSITSLWSQLSNTTPWGKEPVWVHGDFLPGNILVQNNRLSAVIDFSDVGIGDPACDLIIAWSLLKPHSRRVFRNNLENIDDNTWKRGRGWALSIALIMLPYYKNTNPILASLAKRMIENVL